MLPSGHIDHKGDAAISRLINSINYFIDTCFIMDLSEIVQGKKRYRLLAFHEREKKIFVDKYYQTLKGARIGFNKKFKDLACSDKVSPLWTDLYKPDRKWMLKMLSIVAKLKCNYNFKGTDYGLN